MNVLSLFSGIGGLELGLERAGMRVVGQVEIDPFRRAILSRHWPEVPRHYDVRTAPGWLRRRALNRVDLVAGGFPCQPFSHSGLHLGTADERWGWPWFVDVVDVVRPRWILVENVRGLLRDREAFGWILGDLAERGFDAEWSLVSACSVGATHMRRRLFLVAYLAGRGREGRSLAEAWEQAGREEHSRSPGWQPFGGVRRVADGLPERVERVSALGDAVVPQVTEMIGRRIMAADRSAVAA